METYQEWKKRKYGDGTSSKASGSSANSGAKSATSSRTTVKSSKPETYEEWKQRKSSEGTLFTSKQIEEKKVFQDTWGLKQKSLEQYMTSSSDYFGNAQKAYGNMNYSNSSDIAAGRTRMAESLRAEGRELMKWLDQYQDYLDKDTYGEVSKYLRMMDDEYGKVITSFGEKADFYGQFESEDDYNNYVATQKEYEEKANLDLEAADKEISYLERVRDEYSILTRTMTDDRGTARLNELRAEYGELSDLDNLISERRAFRNQAKHIQEGITLSSVSRNDDFKEHSGYVSTKADGWWSNLNSKYGMGYSDLVYEYINNQNGIRDEIDQKHRIYTADNPGSSGESTYKWKGYDLLTEDEIAIYNYYYSRDGKEAAQKYLDSIQETLNYRKAAGMYGNMEDKTALELAFGMVAGYDQFASGITNLFNTEDDYIAPSAYQIASGMVREDLEDVGPKLPQWIGGASLGQVGYDAVTTTANMAPSIVSSIAANMIAPGSGAFVGNTLMFASSAGNAYQEALNLGYDKGQARAYSTMVGASEAGLQYLLGGIGSLGGTSKAVSKMLNGIDDAFIRTAVKIGGNMASEGLEEGLQEILTPWFKNLALHAGEDINWSEVAYSSLLGALTAGVMEGPGTIAGEVNNYRTGIKLQNADISAQRLSEIGKTFSADTVAYQLAGRVNENTGAYTMGRLFNEIGATLSEQNVNDITQALVSKGMNHNDALVNAKAMAVVVEGGNLTDAQVKIIEANDVLADAVRTTIIDSNATWFQRTKGYNEALMALAQEKTSDKKQSPPGQENASASNTVGTQIENGTESNAEPSTDVGPDKVKSIAAINNGRATIKLEDDTEVNVKDADIDPDDGVRIETIASIDGISTSDANFILNTLRESTNASAQMDSLGAKEAYKYGFYGFSEEHLTKHGVFANSLTATQRKAIYEAGKTARQHQVEKTTPKKTTGASKQTGIYFDSGNGNVTAFSGSDMKGLSDKQKAGAKTALVMKKLGIAGDIYFFESYRNSKNQLVYKDRNGNEVKAPNGWYSESDGSIHIDLNAGNKGQGYVLFTLSHELTHFIEQWSPKKYKVLADFLVENYEKGQSMDKLVRAKQARLSELRGEQVSYSEAYSEVVADSMEAMLADGNVLEKLVELKAKDHVLFAKMKQFFDNLAAKIRNIYKGLTPDSAEGNAVLDMKDSIEKIQQLFAEALVEASENFQSAMENVVEANAAAMSENEIITDGAVVTDGEGTKYSIRSMKHDIAEGKMFEDLKTYCGWTQKQVNELRKNLNDLVEYMTPFRNILDMNETYDREGRRFSPYKPNSDPLYKISMDFSTLCSKRLLTQYVIENLQLRENRPMSAEEQMAIRDMLNEYRKVEKGLQVACAMCYVEAARLKSPKQINKWLDDPETQMKNYFADKDPEFASYIKEKQADFKESRGYARNATKKDMSAKDVRELNNIRPRLRSQYQVTAEEMKIIERAKSLPNSTYLTAANLANLSESDPTIYAAYTAFVRTATRSKSLETDEPYYYGDSTRDNGNGIIVTDSFIESVNRENGMRFSSWSDWRIQHLLDYITAVIDNSVRGAAMHGYTKFGEEVRVLGKTGMMFNMSGVAGTQTGLNEDGSLSFSPTESMDVNEAIQLREEFPDTAGLQCIGVSDEHIIALLRSDIIDYIIPYHTSGLNAALRRMANIFGWDDYTNAQHASIDKSIKFEDAVDKEHWHEEPIYSEFFVGYDTGMTGIEAMRASADRYVQMCKDRGLKPKFEKFLKEDNYWKLLIDRKMINQKTGKLIQQKAVTPTFDFGTINDVVDQYVQNYDSNLESRALNHIVENWDSIPQRIRDLKKQGGKKSVKKSVDTLANQTLAAQPANKLSDRESSVENDRATRYSSRYEERFFPGNVFPSGQVHTAVAEWANRRDTKTGDKKLVPYRGAYYRVEKFDDMDFDYLITKKYDAQDYKEELKEYGEIDIEESIQARIDRIDAFNREADEHGNRRHHAGPSGTEYGGEDLPILPMDQGEIGRRDGSGKTERDRPGGLRDQRQTGRESDVDWRNPSLEYTPQELYDKILELDRKRGLAKGAYATRLKNKAERYIAMIDEMRGWDKIRLSDRDNAPTFYSHMARVVDGVKQEKLGAASVVSMLRGKGVKAEEIKWSGIEEFLEGKKSVTKAELQEFIAGSMLQIEEETLTDKEMPYSQEHLDQIAQYEAERDIIVENLKSEWKRIVGTDIPITYFGGDLESTVVQKLLEVNNTKKGETEAGYKYKAARAALQRCIEYNDDYFGYDNERQAFIAAVRDPKDFMSSFEMTSFEEGVFKDFIKAKEAYSKVEGIPMQDQKALKAIAESADRFNRRIYKVKSEHRAEAAKHMTKWSQYKIKGGENYREVLLKIPGSDYYNDAMAMHWDERDGVLAHARIQDLNTFLGKMLFIEEIQSDWHNDGRKDGYASEEQAVRKRVADLQKQWDSLMEESMSASATRSYAINEKMDAIDEERNRLENKLRHGRLAPDAPFRDTYHEYVLKRLIRMAVEQDYDSIGWTPAEIQVKRWSEKYAEGYRIEYDQEIPKFLNKYGKKWGTKVGKTVLDNGTEVWSMAITDSMKDSVLTEGQPLYSDRDTESVSNRSLLANAFEGVAQNDIERNKIQEYKDKIDLINAEERKLSELREQIKELSFAKGPKDTKAIRNLQFEANQAANRISTYDKQLLRLEASAPLQNLLTREKEMARKRAEQKGKEALEAYRERATRTQRELLDRWQESRKRGIDSRNRTAMRHKIKDIVNELNQYLLKGTKDRHVPIGLQKAVAEALNAVNMDTVGAEERIAKLNADLMKAKTPEEIQEISKKIEHIREMGDRLDEKLNRLKAAYDELINSDDPLIANSHDDAVSAHMMRLIVRVGDTPLREMTIDQLQDVYDVYKVVLATIRNANKSFKDNKNREISTRANQVMAEIDNLGVKRGKRPVFMNWIEKFGWDNLKPVYAMEHIGSRGLIEAYNNVRDGEDTWARDIVEAREFYLDKFKKYGYDSWDFEKKSAFTSTTGKDFELTLDQIMSLYAYSKRDQAEDHLKYGGIVFDPKTEVVEQTKHGIKVKYNVANATAYNISEETLADIISKLTPEQKSFVDEMQDYLSTVMGAKGNDVSLAMYDVKLFREKHYFPLKSAHQYMARAKEQAQGDVKIKNSGFSKETKPHAKNPIVLSSFMDVWTNHVNEMSMYHAFVLPMEDFYRIYNYTTPSKNENMPTEGVTAYIENAYGSGATGYIDQMLKDLNGGARTDPRTGFINKLMGMFKKGAVFASLSVVVQQPSAIARATALVDTKYFIGPKVDHKRHKVLWEEVKRYAPVAIIKEMGYFDTNMGKSTQDFILGQEYSGFSEKMKALVTDSNYRDEVLSKAPALADELAWCGIWEAVKRETKANNPEMDTRSEEFLKKAGTRFTEVITKTQVYDSVLSRSANMRSKDTGMMMATAFMAEPTTSINMIADALLQGKRGNRKYCRSAIGAVIASQILNSILVSFVYAARDDDEDESYWEKYIEALAGSMLDSLNPASYIPFIKDIVSIVQGYDVERSDMAVVSDLWKAWQNLFKDDVSAYRKVEGFAGSVCQIFGLPVKNIMRDSRAIYQTVMSFVEGRQTTKAGIGYAVKSALPEWLGGGDVSKQDQLYDAYLSGDETQIARVEGRYKDKSAAESAMRGAIKDRYISGEIDAQTAKKYLVLYGGLDGSDAHWKVEEWDFAKTNESGEEFHKYDGFYEAVRTGKNLKAVIKEYTDNGVKLDTLKTQITTYFKPEYVEMSVAERANIKGYLLNALVLCGDDREDAEYKLKSWDFEAKYGYPYEDRDDAYKSGAISRSEMISILVNDGGKTSEEADLQVQVYDWEIQ